MNSAITEVRVFTSEKFSFDLGGLAFLLDQIPNLKMLNF